MQKIKALALFSGGLDSMISMHLLAKQGIEVYALNFNIGFGSNKDKREYFENAAKQVGATFISVDIKEQFFNNILFKPKYGYGRFFNPCIDCHANMFMQAFYKLKELNAHFVISGEVLGQRPKSQRKEALNQVKKLVKDTSLNSLDSNFKDILSLDGSDPLKPKSLEELILRPMSAKLLEPSFPEKIGWVNRDLLLDISGRGRSFQLEYVKKHNWKYFENPGGGCLLTDTNISLKMKNLLSHRDIVFDDLELLKNGRYLVLENGARCIISRNEAESKKLDKPHTLMEQLDLNGLVGPICLVEKNASKEDKILACKIALSYAKTDINTSYEVRLGDELYSLKPYPKQKVSQFLFIK